MGKKRKWKTQNIKRKSKRVKVNTEKRKSSKKNMRKEKKKLKQKLTKNVNSQRAIFIDKHDTVYAHIFFIGRKLCTQRGKKHASENLGQLWFALLEKKRYLVFVANCACARHTRTHTYIRICYT